eukprot:CAMPEP_0198364552 /NCGR_PEP_ID=MMETSP1450-20131203/153725_1 /TAXON_ID=753684 ORGANISM="Madagascaria erythrocladiodes, Strain CCMP3234" /NCGR_SAMPLE_ID=MMETSP1450 /ASSEMBLY_ACC=CAM_ASM_001115 /LENGTH=289 /DNA_ID=CAMNT_0044071991 /DNA_START=100 /DNA_END=969 /DNA_ORIENTATION=+
MAAFVSTSSFLASPQSFSGAAVQSAPRTRNVGVTMIIGDSRASPRMRMAQTRDTRMTAFANRVNKNMIATSTDIADEFFAASVTRQYKEMVNSTGVYDPQCTEGTASQDAWASREAAKTAEFRATQRSTFEKAHDFFENRKMAYKMTNHICNAEETLFTNYPKLCAAFTRGKSEAMRTCDRYATPETIAEAYMAMAIDKQNKQRACKYGVYSISCSEGIAKGRAEEARVMAGSVAFRAGWKTPSQYTQERYNQKAAGRDYFGHGCEHEEYEFNTFPAAGAAMRSDANRY